MSLSIIVPLFNEGGLVGDSVRKILWQLDHYKLDADLIVVDDCSTDGSLSEVKAVCDSRVKVFETDSNSGSGGIPRNIGISRCESDFLCFYDVGDEIELGHVNQAMKLMCEFGVNLTLFKHQDVHPTGKCFDSPLKVFRQEVYPTNFLASPQLVGNPFSWGKLYKTSWLRENGIRFGSQYSGQDKVFTWHAYLEAMSILVFPSIMYRHVFFSDGRNRMTKINSRLLDSLISIDDDVRPLFDKRNLSHIYNVRLVNRDILGILFGTEGVKKLARCGDLDDVYIRSAAWIRLMESRGIRLSDFVHDHLKTRYDCLMTQPVGCFVENMIRQLEAW